MAWNALANVQFQRLFSLSPLYPAIAAAID